MGSKWETKAHYVYYNMEKLVDALMSLGYRGEAGPNAPASSQNFHNEVNRLLNEFKDCNSSPRQLALGLLAAGQQQIDARIVERVRAASDINPSVQQGREEEAVLAAVKESLSEFTDLRPRKS